MLGLRTPVYETTAPAARRYGTPTGTPRGRNGSHTRLQPACKASPSTSSSASVMLQAHVAHPDDATSLETTLSSERDISKWRQENALLQEMEALVESRDAALAKQHTAMQEEIAALADGVSAIRIALQRTTESLVQDGRISSLNGKLESLDQRVCDLVLSQSKDQRISALQGQLDCLDERLCNSLKSQAKDGIMTALQAQLDCLDQRISDALHTHMKDRCDSHDRMAHLEQLVTESVCKNEKEARESSRTLDAFQAEMDAWKQVLEDAGLDSMEQRMTQLEQGLKQAGAQQKDKAVELDGRLKALQDSIVDCTQKQSDLQAQLQDTVAKCYERQEELQSQLQDSIDSDTTILASCAERQQEFQLQLQDLSCTVGNCVTVSQLNNLRKQLAGVDDFLGGLAAVDGKNNLKVHMQDLEDRIRTKHSEDREQLEARVRDLVHRSATKTGLDEAHGRIDSLQNVINEESTARAGAVKAIQGEFLAAVNRDKAARDMAEDRFMQRLGEIETVAVKRSELCDVAAETEKRLNELQDEHKRTRDTLETSLQDLLRKDHVAQWSQIKEQWDREQKTREAHSEHCKKLIEDERKARESQNELYNKLVGDERNARDAAMKVRDHKIDAFNRNQGRIDALERSVLQEREQIWNAIRSLDDSSKSPERAAPRVRSKSPETAADATEGSSSSDVLQNFVGSCSRTSRTPIKARSFSPGRLTPSGSVSVPPNSTGTRMPSRSVSVSIPASAHGTSSAVTGASQSNTGNGDFETPPRPAPALVETPPRPATALVSQQLPVAWMAKTSTVVPRLPFGTASIQPEALRRSVTPVSRSSAVVTTRVPLVSPRAPHVARAYSSPAEQASPAKTLAHTDPKEFPQNP